jgi:hypothetical protein
MALYRGIGGAGDSTTDATVTAVTEQAVAAAASADAAASSATSAATSASNAASSATDAETAQTAAETAQTAAESAQTEVEAIRDSIESFYLGAEATEPTTDDNGDALTAGDWYFNTTSNQTFIYNGTSFQGVSPDLVQDLTPQLGGDLDLNSSDITGTGNINITGNVSLTGTVDGRDVATDGTKLDGIETGATADQTAAEIKTAYESNSDTNAFTDAEQTKLSGIETNADVTDTANVTAAGALMDSEVTNLAQVKAFDSADYATAAQGALADSALQTETNDLSSVVTWANVPDANITQSSVTQHQAALTITESQISDLGPYDPAGTAVALAIALG